MLPSAPDLLNCADEPLHVPGTIQQHGFLLLTPPGHEIIVAASENSERFLNVPLARLVGAKLEDLLEPEVVTSVRSHANSRSPEDIGQVAHLGAFRIGGNLFSAATHGIGSYRALEFEQQDTPAAPEAMNAVITSYVSTLSRLHTQQEFCDALTRQFAQLTGFDRVMLCTLESDGPGRVLSEVNNGRLPSCLGQAHSASGIPQQARDLFLGNTIRHIPDALHTPSALQGNSSVDIASLDLSRCALRSVSPVHLQNMSSLGAISSLSVSILLDGKLWGLIRGHHAKPRSVPYLIRSTCDTLARITAAKLEVAHTAISLRLTQEAAEESEARFLRLTQALPLKVFTVDDAGSLTFVNDPWREAGLHPHGPWFEDPLLDAEDTANFAQRWQSVVQKGSDFEAELRVTGPNGGPGRCHLLRIIPFQPPGAPRAGWIGTLIDLTERREREMALRMSEKLALTGRMTSVIAHEINNPLEAITNLMYLLRNELPQSGNSATYISMVESELERISGITKQTLRWNRETSDIPETCCAAAMVDEVLRLFAGKIRNRQIRVTISGDRATELRGLLGQLRQVLANLVSNAVDAAPLHGHGVVLIELLQEHSGPEGALTHTGFSVQDNGPGIPAGTRARLFEPFHSTKGDLGNGLGLYISREIVERHHGRIEVATNPGEGTVMTVLLPA